MDPSAIQTIVSHMKGRSFYDILAAMFHNHFIDLNAARWTVEIDGKPLGRVVMSHNIVLDDVLGNAYETWAWTEKGQARVLHVSGSRDGELGATLDGTDVHNPVLELETRENEGLQVFLKVHIEFESHNYAFEGLLE